MSHVKYSELLKFTIKDVKRSNCELGTGSFGSVQKLTVKGKHYAGKTYHESSLYPHSGGAFAIMRRFASECRLLSQIHHPNIIEFIGLCFFQEYAPTLIMELMPSNLESLINNTADIQFDVKCYILRGIATGLAFLHSNTPPLVHRDLTSHNVLLNEDASVVKISDFRNVFIVDSDKVVEITHKNPVALAYMPPEALVAHPQLDPPLDIFSFGQLALYTMLQKFPGNLIAKFYSETPSTRTLVRTELERRKVYFGKLNDLLMASQASIIKLIEKCFEDAPSIRYQ